MPSAVVGLAGPGRVGRAASCVLMDRVEFVTLYITGVIDYNARLWLLLAGRQAGDRCARQGTTARAGREARSNLQRCARGGSSPSLDLQRAPCD